MRGQRQWGKYKMRPGIKGSFTQPCVERWKLTWYCLASSCQVTVICKMFFSVFFTEGVLEMASFLRDDKVNPILSSIWRKRHFKLVLHLSNEPVSSTFTEYLWMEDSVRWYQVIKMNWEQALPARYLISGRSYKQQNFAIFCFSKLMSGGKQMVIWEDRGGPNILH